MRSTPNDHEYIGNFGCYNNTPNDIALCWFADLFDVFKEFGWGYSLWSFAGDYGIVKHSRPGGWYEELHGYLVDRDLLDLRVQSRVPA